jgi:hypothetical protein
VDVGTVQALGVGATWVNPILDRSSGLNMEDPVGIETRERLSNTGATPVRSRGSTSPGSMSSATGSWR